MPCASSGLVGIKHKEVKDYTQTHPYTPPLGIFRPDGLRQLVRCIQQAEAEKRSIKAQGSGYSLSHAAVADDYLICTDDLNKWLSRPLPFASTDSRWFRSDAHNHDLLTGLVRPEILTGLKADSALIHVEAGIKIGDLLKQLDDADLALPTMGAGGGQSLAGAMSTGTHGSDFKLAPMFDLVRAIHLVGPGGQEWWIEPSRGFSTPSKLSDLPGWCGETKVVRDDD
jgi:FAD/FMN-containing dehydrogenase